VAYLIIALPGDSSVDAMHATVEQAVFSTCLAAGAGAVTSHINSWWLSCDLFPACSSAVHVR
jgi:hypothetical protein